MSPRPTRALVVVSVFLVGVYPPVIWTALWLAAAAPPAAIVPLIALAGLTGTLIALWRPSRGGWVGAMVVFGFGWTVSATLLALAITNHDKPRLPFDAAGLAYHTLAIATLLWMKLRWSAWAENRSPAGGERP